MDQNLPKSHDYEALEARIEAFERGEGKRTSLVRAIQDVQLNSGSAIGDRYFPAIVKDIARVLDADYVFVGQLTADSSAVETISVCADGKIVDNMTYNLAQTPCKLVMGRGACVYPSSVTESFPNDQLLVDMHVDGYVGIPLFDSEGVASGIIVALYRTAVPDTDFASTLILVFAARTAAELDRRRHDEEARQLEAQMLQSQKLESLGVLAGGLAHDFNNLLSSMLGSADLALDELPRDHEACQHLTLIHNAATDAGALCRQLLAYAGKGRFELGPVNLSRLVRDQHQLLESSVSRKAALIINLDDKLPNCHADISQMRQILLNLVVNASEAIQQDGGVIRVTTGTGYFDAKYLASSDLENVCKPGSYVFIEVSDTGEGMSQDVRNKLFDPFFTTKRTGRGLGLAAILGIVKGHGGSIRIYTEQNHGSSFKVFFPVSMDRDPVITAKPKDRRWRGSGMVLLVDDDEQVANVSMKMLKSIGFDAIVASNGTDALEIYCKRSKELAAVVLDLTMPGMSGDEVFREMRLIDDSVPVVLTSGFNEQDTIQSFVGRGLAGFLQKPVRLEDMRQRLRNAVEHKPS